MDPRDVEISRLREQNFELRLALRPFAKAYEYWHICWFSDDAKKQFGLRVRDFRRAVTLCNAKITKE